MLQTPTRVRIRSQDDGYATPTSAHISRWARGNVDQRQQIIPLVLPHAKSSTLRESWSTKPRTFKEMNATMDLVSNAQRVGTMSPRHRKKSGMGSDVTGFDIWQDGRENAENINHAETIDQSNGGTKGDRSPYVLKSGWSSVSKPRMGRRSITFPGTEKGTVQEDHRMESPARKRVNSDRSDISATRSPLRSIQPSAPTLIPPATPTPSSSQMSRPSTQPIDKTILAPPTPSRGGLRRKSKFIARQSLGRPAKNRDEVMGATDTEDAEVEGVEKGVQAGPQLGMRTGSWMTEVGADVEEAIASQVSVDLELGDLSQLSQGTSGSQEMAAASQTTRDARRSELIVVEKNLRRSARLSAGRTSSSPRPGNASDPFQTGDVSVESSHAVFVVASNRMLAKIASPKPSARRRKRSSEANTIAAGSTSVTYESPNPRAKKNARKSVLVVEIPTSVSRMVGSPMRGVVRTSQGGNEAPVTPKRVTVAKRQAPATDRPVAKSSKTAQSSSQGSIGGKPRKSLGSQLDWMAANADTSGSSTIKRKKGRKSLAPRSVVKDLHARLDHPPRPSSPGEDVLLLVGVEETLENASQRARSRTVASNTPQPRKGPSKNKGKGSIKQADTHAQPAVSMSPGYQDEVPVTDASNDSPARGEPSPLPAPSSGLRVHSSYRRSYSPDFPQPRQDYSPDTNWSPLEFSVFGEGACDSSPPSRPSPVQSRIYRIAPTMHDFTQVTTSTPMRTPLSKKRKSTPHQRPILSSTPARSEDARSERDAGLDENADGWSDAGPVDSSGSDMASEGDWAAGDRGSSPDYQDAEEATIQEGNETQRAPSNEPEPPHDIVQIDQAETSESPSDERDPGGAVSAQQTEAPSETGAHVGEGEKTAEPITSRTDPYITVRTVEIKLEEDDEPVQGATQDYEGIGEDHQAGPPTKATAANEVVPQDQPQQNDTNESVETAVTEVSLADKDPAKSVHPITADIPAVAECHTQIGENCVLASKEARENSVTEQMHLTLGDASTVSSSAVPIERSIPASTEEPAGQAVAKSRPLQNEMSGATGVGLNEEDEAILGHNIDADDDYTKFPIIISSKDPRAAALAAAVLRQSKRYVELGSQPTEDINKLKRRRSQYFVSAEAASVLTPAELIKEAELELMDEELERQQSEVRRQTIAPASMGVSSEDLDWNRDDWAVLNRCYHKSMKQNKAKGKGRENSVGNDVDVQAVFDLLVFKRGLTKAQLRDGKYNKTALSARINNLHRYTQKKAARAASFESTLSPTERSTSVAIAAMESVSPIVKKSKTSESASKVTKIEVHVDKKSHEASSASSVGWWGSVSNTWRRIKSSVSLASLQQTDEEPLTAINGVVGSSDQREQVIEHIDAVFASSDKEESLRRRIARPRRALPGGLITLPIDTPAQMTSVNPSRLMTMDTGRHANSVLASRHILDRPTVAASGTGTCPTARGSAQSSENNATPARPITLPRSIMGTTTTSPRVKDLVRSFEDAAHRSVLLSADRSIENDARGSADRRKAQERR